MPKKRIACVILAAGKGERMKSGVPKVLHPICNRPMLGYVLDLVKGLKIDRTVLVLGYKQALFKKLINPGIRVVIQKNQRGTADAVRQAGGALKNFKGTLLVLYADNPLLKKETLAKLLRHHIKNNLDATLLVAKVEKPFGYGRILRDRYYAICGIAEEKDASDFQKDIKEINTGIMCFNKDKLFGALGFVKPNNRKKEYYLTDTIGILCKNSALLDSVRISDIDEALGINSRAELAKANRIMQKRINEEFMKNGVSIVDPDSTFISYDAKIGSDSTIYPFTVIEKNVKIGKSCRIGPFAHLREGAVIEDTAAVGNFAEIVRSRLGKRTYAKHFSYIGDSRIGSFVNIGAGTVTANFDGKKKNTTVIKNNAFIGSDTVLVAPVKIGKSAKTGAGSVVLKNRDVADNAVVAGVPAKPLKTNKQKR